MSGDDKDFEELKNTWSRLAEVDPLWAILTNPDKKGGRWDIESFLLTGTVEIEQILEEITFLDYPMVWGRALDFGCGVGRLTQPLGKHFKEAHGVDIAPSMIESAQQLAGSDSNCHFHLNQKEDLGLFAEEFFDFIYSRLVLQHMNPIISKKYISEFMRIVKPGGLIAFQLPAPRGVEPAFADIVEIMKPSARFVAEIEVDEKLLRLSANESQNVTVRLKNTSQVSWLSEEDSDGKIQINLGYRWLRNNGFVFKAGDERSPIPYTLDPGQGVELTLNIKAPEFGGDYLLELDMVQEGVCWFKEKGNRSKPIPVEVDGPQYSISYGQRVRRLFSNYRNRLSDLSIPKFEMHGVPVSEVTEVIEENGGQVVAMQFANSVGPDEPGFFYYVTK